MQLLQTPDYERAKSDRVMIYMYMYGLWIEYKCVTIDQFRYIKIQPKTNLSMSLWGIKLQSPQNLVLWSVVLG